MTYLRARRMSDSPVARSTSASAYPIFYNPLSPRMVCLNQHTPKITKGSNLGIGFEDRSFLTFGVVESMFRRHVSRYRSFRRGWGLVQAVSGMIEQDEEPIATYRALRYLRDLSVILRKSARRPKNSSPPQSQSPCEENYLSSFFSS